MCVRVLEAVCLVVWLLFGICVCLFVYLRASVRAVVLSMVQCHGESNAAVAEQGLIERSCGRARTEGDSKSRCW